MITKEALKAAKSALENATYLIQYNDKIGTAEQAGRWTREYEIHYTECRYALQLIEKALEE